MPETIVQTEDRLALIARITGFINRIGIPCREERLQEGTFLPGIEIKEGGISYDPELMKYPGDLLHEAGHMAILYTADRVQAGASNINGDLDAGGAEMGAIAWSWAALTELELEPSVVFHEYGYKGDAAGLIERFSGGRYVAVELLQWMGMTTAATRSQGPGDIVYPKMKNWLRVE
jgi:hypothetical protein